MSILWRMVRAVVRGHTSRELRVGDYPLLALEPVQPVPSLADFYVPVRQDARTESGQGPKPIAWLICAQKLSVVMASHERFGLLAYGGARIGCGKDQEAWRCSRCTAVCGWRQTHTSRRICITHGELMRTGLADAEAHDRIEP